MKYSAYDLNISTTLDLPFLKKTSFSSTNHNIKFSSNARLSLPPNHENAHTYTSCSSEEAIYYRKDVGIFKITGNSIEFKRSKSVDINDFTRVLLGLPIGYSFLLRNKLVFHGSSVNHNGDAHIFIGKSGMGKSTIVYDLMKLDSKFITEDICCINKNKIIFSFPIIKLSKNIINNNNFLCSSDGISFNTDHLGRMGYKIKSDYLSYANNSLKNCYIFIESKDDEIQIKKLNGAESIPFLMNNSFKGHPIIHQREFLKINIARIIEFVKKNNIYLVSSSKNNFKRRNEFVINHINEYQKKI